MAKCVVCEESIGGETMGTWKAKCKCCGSLHCDECYERESIDKGAWVVMDCEECDEPIWRKSEW